jgi:hypothetical protein
MNLATRLRDPRTQRPILWTAGLFGWLAFAWLLSQMYRGNPPGAGFDLELLITGGRHVAIGLSPYDTKMLAGGSVQIADLFYTYPPLVAQLFSTFSFLPSTVILAVALVAAGTATVAVGCVVATVAGSAAIGRAVALPLAALLPFWFPYTVGALFANIDIFFPALYGLILVAVLTAGRPRSERWVLAGGISLAVASLIKLHPAVLGLWLLARGWNERRHSEDVRRIGPLGLPRSWRIAAISIVVVAAVLGASVAVGGLEPWRQYIAVLRAGASVDLLDRRNLGPAVQLVMLLGLGPAAVGPVQVVVLAMALIVAIAAALRVRDPLESLTWAAIASFIVLPVTWFHHFAALVPFGIAALARGSLLGPVVMRRLWMLVLVAFAIVMIGFAQPPTWLLVPLFLAAARISRPASGLPDELDRAARPAPAAQPSG